MPRPARLTQDGIVDAALGLVDRKGIEGLTMRALARELGVDPMAVYRHVRDKDALLGLMCDRLLDGLDELDLDAPWEPQVRELAARVHERLAARPALLPALASAPVTPASLLAAAQTMELLVRAGFRPRDASDGVGAVFSYVLGFAVLEAAPPPPADEEQLRREVGEVPQLDAALDLMRGPGDFERGLDLVLAGVRASLGP